MRDRDELARRFEEHRELLRAIAYRMLGSLNEAEDAVQEAWLRLDRATGTTETKNGGRGTAEG
ncbi:RNA polymerase subunit sigma-70, partial [Nocardia sp. MDA0666]